MTNPLHFALTTDTREITPGAPVDMGGYLGYLTQRAAFRLDQQADPPSWTRMAWLFSSVEAIAFGAAGDLPLPR